MVSLILKAASVGLILYGLTLTARSGRLNKATLMHGRQEDGQVGA